MRLYHFTSAWNVWHAGPNRILDAGLLPLVEEHDGMPGTPPCVWLTTERNMKQGHSNWSEVRIEVEIHANDPLLHHWVTFLRRTGNLAEFRRALLQGVGVLGWQRAQRWYVHFGPVPLDALREIGYGPDQSWREDVDGQ